MDSDNEKHEMEKYRYNSKADYFPYKTDSFPPFHWVYEGVEGGKQFGWKKSDGFLRLCHVPEEMVFLICDKSICTGGWRLLHKKEWEDIQKELKNNTTNRELLEKWCVEDGDALVFFETTWHEINLADKNVVGEFNRKVCSDRYEIFV